MELGVIYALGIFAFVSTFTPGPNNIMLLTSGANVGFVKTLPHMAGIMCGFSFMVIVVGIGLGSVFELYPQLQEVLKWACLSYLLFLTYKIVTSKSELKATDYQPMTFLGACMFQWVNPKGWSMALTSITVYNTTSDITGVFMISAAFALANIPSGTLWTLMGREIGRLLNSPKRLSMFNWLMGALLLGSTLPMI
ncbi:LysE family transporter [Vibrio astriarenae]|uniref:LysE family transporter n=1 Tax=Vibrio astriarenae TaxID=1481923 RepID=A0A7Z2YDL3_9VIBR|nr:LysE family translocator [Vibrio astriarenae]QIA63451.1 LysE family transporter [Vibrio astriarenae]